jgi:SAM-dependent methyltransferase
VDFQDRTEDDLKPFYAQLFGTEDYERSFTNSRTGEAQWRAQFRILRRLMRDDGKTEKKILDLGCSAGHFLANAPPHFVRYGVEAYEPAARRARQKGIRLHTGGIETADFLDVRFDVITMFAFLEHVLDPAALLRLCTERLAEGGLLVVMTGDAGSLKARLLGESWHMYCPPIHQFFFSARSLDRLLRGLGYRKVKAFYTDGGMTNFHNRYLQAVLRRLMNVLFVTPGMNLIPFFDHYYAYFLKCSRAS